MIKPVQLIHAPCILGLRPTGVERLADVLISCGLKEMVGSTSPLQYLPTGNHLYSSIREPGSVLNMEPLAVFVETMYNATIETISNNTFPLVLGGDCSIIIGIIAAMKSMGSNGLIFMDAHADFYLPEQSVTGEAADMDLAIVTGRGKETLANFRGLKPYVEDHHVFHIGQRDQDQASEYGSARIEDTAINCFSEQMLRNNTLDEIGAQILGQARSLPVRNYWIHFDTDVISDALNPAVDYRLPGGLSFQQCEYLLSTFLRNLPVAGMSVSIFNPELDEGGLIGKGITALLQKAFIRARSLS